MSLKFNEQMNEIAERIEQDNNLTEKEKEQELNKLNEEIRSITD
jgi:hypothetical protein